MIMSEHNIYRYIFKTSWSIIIWSWYWHLGSILGHEGIPTQIESLSRNRTIPKLIRWNFRSSQLYVYQYLITYVIKFIKSISHDIKFMIYLIPIKCDHISFSPILKLSFFLYLPIISHPPFGDSVPRCIHQSVSMHRSQVWGLCSCAMVPKHPMRSAEASWRNLGRMRMRSENSKHINVTGIMVREINGNHPLLWHYFRLVHINGDNI